ncbi:MAG: shikimate dehydrogenase [Gemmatimonadales bacterium]|nr:MAG: shikimate dehydrogenase [Gemmatimonadales bacterium]
MTRLLVLLGDPVAHSLSPRFQNAALEAENLDARYIALRADGSDLAGLLRGIARAGGAGNVTLPHKGIAARTVEVSTEAVRLTGACNTFWLEDGAIHGDNTDVDGLRGAIGALLDRPLDGSRSLVLGAGGAARAAVLALAREGAATISVRNRTRSRAERLVEEMADGVAPTRLEVWTPVPDSGRVERSGEGPGMVVNATSLGLRESDPLPLDPAEMPAGSVAMDLVYAKGETGWVRRLREAGWTAADGREMLLRQGALSFERWWGRPAPMDAMRKALDSSEATP